MSPSPSKGTDEGPTSEAIFPPDVLAYLKHVLIFIVLGIALMAGTAVWAWNTYAGKIADAPPLPSGAPPLSSAPITRN